MNSIPSRLIAASLLAALIPLTSAQAESELGGTTTSTTPAAQPATQIQEMDELQASSACEAMTSALRERLKQEINAQKLSEDANLCGRSVREANNLARKLGSEFFVAGLGIFIGLEGNGPKIPAKIVGLVPNAYLAVGGSAFITLDPKSESGFPAGLRVAPMGNLSVGTDVLSLNKGRPNLLEPQMGVIVFIGNRETKTIFDLNGWYGAAGIDLPNPFAAEVQNKTTVSVRVLTKNPLTGPYGLTVVKSFSAGSNVAGGSVDALFVNNIDSTNTGAGIRAIDMAYSVLDNTLNLFGFKK